MIVWCNFTVMAVQRLAYKTSIMDYNFRSAGYSQYCFVEISSKKQRKKSNCTNV